MAARDAGEVDRLDHFLQLTLQLLGERPAVPDHLWIAVDELRQDLATLRPSPSDH